MKDYYVIALYDCSDSGASVKAESPEKAIEYAVNNQLVGDETICYHCARKLELGDLIGYTVSDGENDYRFDDFGNLVEPPGVEPGCGKDPLRALITDENHTGPI